MKAPFENRSSILKSKLDFEIEAPFRNQSTILKSKLYFQMKAPFEKSKFAFEI